MEFTSKKMKHRLPSYFKIVRHHFDISRLQAELDKVSNEFTGVLESNRELCANNHLLVESVAAHYQQVSLTTFAEQKNTVSMEDCKVLSETLGQEHALSKTEKYRLKINRQYAHSAMDEKNHRVPTASYTGSYFEECVRTFGGDVMRVRLVKLKAQERVDWHIDYDPSYATRIIVPIVTNSQVLNHTRRRNQIESMHLPADGYSWFLNTGFSHSVVNGGDEDRIILMFSLDGYDLLQEISEAWRSGEPNLK